MNLRRTAQGSLVLVLGVLVARDAAAQMQPAAQQAFAEGQALVAAKRPADAAERFEAAVAAEPSFAPAWYALAAARRRAGQCERAIPAYRRYALLEPEEVEPYYGLGLCLRDVGDKKAAAEALFRYVAQEKRPTSQRWVEHARSVLAEIAPGPGRAGSSAASASPGPRHAPETPATAQPPTRPAEPLGLGPAAASPDGMVPPSSPAAVAYADAQSLRDRGHIEEALAKFRQAIGADPTHMAARAALGELLLKVRRDDEAISVFRAAVDKNAQYPLAWYELAFALRMRGHLPDAVDAYQHYIKLRPTDPDPYFGMARALQKLGRKDAALRAYQAYVSMEQRPTEQRWVQAAAAQIEALGGAAVAGSTPR